MNSKVAYKTATIEVWYPKPQYLIGAIEELKIRAGTLHTVVAYMGTTNKNEYWYHAWPGNHKRWAMIWVRRYSRAEYKIGLQIFNQVRRGIK